MTQYIDKSALVAEIERLKERFIAFHHRDGNYWPLDNYGKMQAYNEVLSFLNTLEVKEVKLDEEITIAMPHRYSWSGDGSTLLYTEEQMKDFAKHFFELGLKASQKEERDATQQEIQDRMEVCPWREHSTGNHYVCIRFSNTNVPCNGACMWVIDNLKLKELKSKLKAQKGEEV